MTPLAAERTVGILGFGELGEACAEMLRKLDFRVLGWSRNARPERVDGIVCYAGSQGLKEVLSRSDILVILLPDTPATENLINSNTLSRCRHGVFIINAGRGNSINDDDLLAALDAGVIGGATLDVFRHEPLGEGHPFWLHPRVLVTPHVAAKTRVITAVDVIVENMKRCEEGRELLYVVDRCAGY